MYMAEYFILFSIECCHLILTSEREQETPGLQKPFPLFQCYISMDRSHKKEYVLCFIFLVDGRESRSCIYMTYT